MYVLIHCILVTGLINIFLTLYLVTWELYDFVTVRSSGKFSNEIFVLSLIIWIIIMCMYVYM